MRVLIRVLAVFFLLCAFSAAQAVQGQAFATVRPRPLHSQLQLFSQVTPQHQYRVTASLAGRVTDLKVNNGDPVRQGDVIAQLTGPSVHARLQSAQQMVSQDQADLKSAQSILTLVEQKRRQKLATQEQLLKARSAVSQARTQLSMARSQQQSLQARTQLVAPTEGQVTALAAANGDYVTAGQTLLQILPNKGLWIQARAYGQDGQRVKVGQSGQFETTKGQGTGAVKVVAKVPDVTSPGTWLLYLLPQDNAGNWFAGQAGTVTLTQNVRQLPAVPSAALIMDQGQWWVMLKSGQTSKPVQVDPVASDQGWTWLNQQGLAGKQVMVRGAYQAYHRSFSKQYANPD